MSKRIVLITGANSGIGLETVKALAVASPSFHIVMTGRSLDKINEAKANLESSHSLQGTLSTLQLDVTDEESVTQAVKTFSKNYDHLDILINNAGVAVVGPNAKERYLANFTTNVIGAVQVSEGFRPLLFKSDNPYSIYISSSLGSLTQAEKIPSMAYWDAYSVSKSALDMVAVTEKIKYADTKLKVFVVCPGLVVSNLRGTSEQQRSAGGRALSVEQSGKLLLDIVEGNRDDDVGKFVHKDGVYTW